VSVRNNIGRVKTKLDVLSRRSELFFAKTQYGLGNSDVEIRTLGATADDASGDEPSTEYLWGIHRWGSSTYRVGE